MKPLLEARQICKQFSGVAVLKGIDLENEEVTCGHCYYFPGGALRVSKVVAGQVKEVEVIRSRNVNIMPNL